MAFTPNPSLFVENFTGGLRAGSAITDLIRQKRDSRELQRLAQLAKQGQYEDLGAGLIGIGEVGPGIAATNVPYNREQQRLEVERQNQQTEFLNSLARDRANREAIEANQPLIVGNTFVDRNNPGAGATPIPGLEDAASGDDSYTTPVQAVDQATGKPVFLQTSKSGKVKIVEGFSPLNPFQKIDTGTEILTADGRTGEIISSVKKDKRGEAYESAVGTESAKADVKAVVDWPKAEATANELIALVDKVEKHPGLDAAMGVIKGKLSPLAQPFKAQEIEDFRALKGQLTGNVFLQAFEYIKGAGQITEIEGTKATDALLAMRDTQSPEQFKELLDTFRTNVKLGMKKAKDKAERAKKNLDGGAPLPVVTPVPGAVPAPEGVDPAIWEVMTPEERAAWQ